MYKILFVFLVSSFALLQGASTLEESDKVEIFATKMTTENNIITATGDVAVAYKDAYLTATKAVYNKTTGDLELFENVRANQTGEYKTLGNYAKLNIKKKERSFQPFYMLEKKSQVWLSADKGEIIDRELELDSGVVSSCDPADPLWKMEFTSSDYDLDSKWLNLYNTRLYIYDIPVFYTPWFGYPLDKTRRTGLLKPTLGFSTDEGFYYEQPIYIAEYDSWDLELNPQIRTNRGKGIYSTFRFADSKHSKGELTVGTFSENDDYAAKNQLVNQDHNGFNFKYINSDVVNHWAGTNLEGQSGLYIDIGYMNDVDYINLAANNTLNISTATQVLSQVNLFYNNEDDYFGLYMKYYQDLTKESNAETIQQLPTLHYHHYLESFFDQHLTYNVDVQSNNIFREKNKTVTQTDINVPVSLHTTLFDEYIDLSFKSNLFLQQSTFSGNEQRTGVVDDDYENGYTAKNDNIISVSTQLTKSYKDFSHVISFASNYVFDGMETDDGFYKTNKEFCQKSENAGEPICDFYNISDVAEELQFDFSQYLYDETGKQIVYHRLVQNILLSDGSQLGDLENELDWVITDELNFYNNMLYNHDKKQFSKIYNRVSYNQYGFNISLSHLYKDTFLDSKASVTYNDAHTSYLTTALAYQYNSHYRYHASYSYDTMDSLAARRKEVGFLYSKRCWDFGIRYVSDIRPVLKSTGISSVPEEYIYFTINLRPFMQTGNNPFFAYKLPSKEE